MKKSILFILAFWAYTLCALAETTVSQTVSTERMDFDGLDVHCLVKGTKITMADGSEKNIEEIKEGDEVLSYTTSNTTGKSMVKAVAQKNHTNFVTVSRAGGASPARWTIPSSALNSAGFRATLRRASSTKDSSTWGR